MMKRGCSVLGTILAASSLAAACTGDKLAPGPGPDEASACSPRVWTFDDASGARAEGQDLKAGSLPVAGPLGVSPGPSFEGSRSAALAVKVNLTRENYSFRVALPACEPSESNNMLEKRLSFRMFFDGPPLAPDGDFGVLVMPHLDGPRLKSGAWVSFEGRLQPPTPEIHPNSYRDAKELFFTFHFTGTEAWSGTLWLDDVRIQN